jgi:hypothetical protein
MPVAELPDPHINLNTSDKIELLKLWMQEGETRSRLFYGMWIVFLGGFLVSLHPFAKLSTGTLVALFLFRSLAIAGTVINFWMQIAEIRFRRYYKESVQHSIVREELPMKEKYKLAQAALNQTNLCSVIVYSFGVCFLLLGLVLSFIVHVPAS